MRPLADLIRGKFADEALDILKYQPQRGARMLEKVLKSALGNAEDPTRARQTFASSSWWSIDARVDGGPMFKRIRPRPAAWRYGSSGGWRTSRVGRRCCEVMQYQYMRPTAIGLYERSSDTYGSKS